jgi:predicted nucleotidyltransferase
MNNAILSILKEHKQELFDNYPIKSLALFGSYSRGDFKKDSDVDILVELTEPDAYKFIDLADQLEKILQKKVDLVSRGGVKQKYFDYFKNQLQYV